MFWQSACSKWAVSSAIANFSCAWDDSVTFTSYPFFHKQSGVFGKINKDVSSVYNWFFLIMEVTLHCINRLYIQPSLVLFEVSNSNVVVMLSYSLKCWRHVCTTLIFCPRWLAMMVLHVAWFLCMQDLIYDLLASVQMQQEVGSWLPLENSRCDSWGANTRWRSRKKTDPKQRQVNRLVIIGSIVGSKQFVLP